jgi:hypothetical protein
MTPRKVEYRRVIGMAFRVVPDIEDLLEALATTVRGRAKYMEKVSAEKKPGDEFPDDDWFVDEGALIDDALGLAFVTCQLFITGVVSACHRLHRFHAARSKVAAGGGKLAPIAKLSGAKDQLLVRQNPPIGCDGRDGSFIYRRPG